MATSFIRVNDAPIKVSVGPDVEEAARLRALVAQSETNALAAAEKTEADVALAQAAANQNAAADIASGLADTLDGEFFTVRYQGVAEFRTYLNNSGAAIDYPQRGINDFKRNLGELAVMVLPEPSIAPGRYLIWKQSPPVRVYSDGSKWWDTTVSPWAEIEAWWVPARAVACLSLERQQYYENGALQSIGDSDLVAVTGGYRRNDGLGVTNEITTQFEYRHDHSQTVSGNFLSWHSPSPNRRWEFSAQNINADRKLALFFAPKSTTGSDNIAWSYGSKTNEGGSFDGRGRQRIAGRFKDGEPANFRVGPSEIHPVTFGDGANIAVSAPDKFNFSTRAFDNGEPLTGSELFQATIWAEKLSDDEFFEIQAPIGTPHFHLLTDSFGNLYKTFDAFRLALEANNDRYYAISQDGVGGTSVRQQAVRFRENYEKWHPATLVILDGGRDYLNNPGTVEGRNALNDAGLHSILETLPHDQWVLLESAPNTNEGSDQRIEWDASEAHMRAITGQHWVETLAPMQALSNGGPDDTNYVNNLNLHPLSLRESEEDFHPNFAGYTAHGGIAASAVIVRGYDVVTRYLPLYPS